MTTGLKTFDKTPDEVLDFTVEWKKWLIAASGDASTPDTISTSTWTLDTGITKDSDTNDTDSTTVWISGGTKGSKYKAVNKIVTAASRTAERTIEINVEEYRG